MPTRRERIEGGVAGLPIGDALGVPYGLHGPDEIPPVEQIEHEPLVEGYWRLGDAELPLDCPWNLIAS
ncbi:MAG TPA: hypothetical protein VKT52_03095 [Ktedonobacterales bacterium]|nr:hypothetical protein [Ktedonobacterales bacterium]